MNPMLCRLLASLVIVNLIGCADTIRELREAQKPVPSALSGAYDSPLPQELRNYTVRFLDRYLISHAWVTTSGCHYGSLPVEYRETELLNRSGDRFVFPIFEQSGQMWQDMGRDETPLRVDRFFKSIKGRVPVYENVGTGAAASSVITGYRETEDGLRAWCLQTWSGLQVALGVRWHRLTVAEWIEQLKAKHQVDGITVTQELVGTNHWTVFTVPPQPLRPGYYTGPYKFYLLPVGDTGFTMQFWLSAVSESFSRPREFAVLGGVFRQLLESVRVDDWNETTKRRYRELEVAAFDTLRRECRRPWMNSPKPTLWCTLYGGDSPRPFQFQHQVP